ncbi:MAG: hypothetical protein ACI9TV_001502 [Sulfurimonas sp.]|jgi:hypothetical protein
MKTLLSLIQVKSVAPIKIKKSRSRVIGRNKKQGTSTLVHNLV